MKKDIFAESLENQIAYENIELSQCPEEQEKYWTGRISSIEDILKRYMFMRDNCQQCQEDDCVVSFDGTCAKTRTRVAEQVRDADGDEGAVT